MLKALKYAFFGLLALLAASCIRNDHLDADDSTPEQLLAPSDDEILAMVPSVRNTAYYKDFFLDGGCCLNPGVKVNGKIVNGRMPAVLEQLGLSYEFFVSSVDDAFASPKPEEAVIMNSLISGDSRDPNGVLLYPDGEPRFKSVFIFGGSSSSHGNQLSTDSRAKFKTFFMNGGSYLGSCAGAFLAGNRAEGKIMPYFNIWEGGNMIHTGLNSSSTSMSIPSDSPLLKYGRFGGDGQVAGIRHNGGGYMDESSAPAGTEILARFGTCPGGSVDAPYYNKVSVWAYKPSLESGRLVVCGSHPEDGTSGEILEFTSAMYRYALDGVGCAKVKDVLHDGECKSTNLIGDRQCHHFVFYLTKDNVSVTLELSSAADADLQLYVKKDTFAFPEDEPDFVSADISSSVHTITAGPLTKGLWFVTVRCNSEIDAVPVTLDSSHNKGMYYKYKGNDLLLSGVPYLLKYKIDK